MPFNGNTGRGLMLVLAAAVALLGAGCGGTGATSPSAQTGQTAALAEGLPQPLELMRDAAAVETQLFALGANFRADKPSQGATAAEGACVLAPMPDGAAELTLPEAAFACYSFDLSPLGSTDLPLRVQLQAESQPADAPLRAFVAIGRPDGRAWQWGELQPVPDTVNSWSWGETQSGSFGHGGGMGHGRVSPVLPVVVMVFDTTLFRVESVQVMPDEDPLAAGPVTYRRGWDGTVKGTKLYDDSMRVIGDGEGQVFTSFYDSSNGQLYFTRLQNRLWTTQALDIDGDAGLHNDLLRAPGGGLLLAYSVATGSGDGEWTMGYYRTLPPDLMSELIWSPRSNFDSGIDDGGLPVNAGANVRCAYDTTGVPHMFYEETTSHRIRHAWKPLGAMEWLHDYVSPEGQVAGRPVGVARDDGGMVCVYMAQGQLLAAHQDALGWTVHVLADDVANPLDETAEIGFCDAAVRQTDGVIVVAYSARSSGGGGCGKVVFQDMHFMSPPESRVFTDREGAGAYMDLAMMGDGSVRIAHFNPREYKVYFETGDIPSQEFTSLPAVQFMPDEDCDDISFWVDPDDDGDGMHDAALFTLSSRLAVDGTTAKKEFKGHVTLLK